MSFGSVQGTVRYATVMDSTQAERSTQTLKQSFTSLGTVSQKTSRDMTSLNQAFVAGVNPMKQQAGTITTLTTSVKTLGTSFTASLNPIKQQGSALTNLTTNLKAQSTEVTSLGTKIKSAASRFSGFATGLSATTSGVLQLNAGFRDYNDAQIAVERVTRKNSLAHEALGKAQDKLQKLTSKGITSGKEYQQAQLDVSQAQAQVSIQTQLLGEAQERLFDSQTQFVASVIPTTLGAIGTLGAAFRDLGGEKGFSGLVTKFKSFGTGIVGAGGGIKGFASSIVSSVIPSLTSLGGDKGLSGLTDKFKNAGKSASGLKGNLLGLGATVGVVGLVTAGALELADAMNQVIKPFSTIKQPVSALEASIDKTGKSMDVFNQTLAETEAMTTAGVTPAIVALDAVFKTHMTETLLKNAGYLDQNGKKTQLFIDKIAEMNTKLIESGKVIPPVGQAVTSVTATLDKFGIASINLGSNFKISAGDYVKIATNMFDSGSKLVDVTKYLTDSSIKEADARKIAGAAAQIHNDKIQLLTKTQLTAASGATNLTGETAKYADQVYAASTGTGVFTGETEKLRQSVIAADKPIASINDNMGLAAASIANFGDSAGKTNIILQNSFGGTQQQLVKLFATAKDKKLQIVDTKGLTDIQQYLQYLDNIGSGAKSATKETQVLAQTIEKQNKAGADFIQRFTDANAIAAEKMDDFNLAITAGNDKFNEFVKTAELGAVTSRRYHDALLQTVGAQVQIPPALDLTTSQLESMQVALDNSKVGLTENTNASAILADALDQQLAPSIQTLGGALTALSSKEFKKAFKDLDFGAAGKGFKKFASELDKDISQINKEAGRMDVIFSQLSVALSIDKLPRKQWVEGLQGISKEVTKIGKIQKIDLSGITDFIAKAQTIKDPVQLAKYQKVIALITEKSKGGFNSTELDAIATAIAGIGDSSGTAAPKVDKNAAAIKTFGVSSVSARGQIDAVTGAIDILAGQAAKVHPTITINTDQALGLIGELKRAWDKVAGQIEKKIPKITVNPNQALDMIGELKRGWDKAAGQIEKKIPKLKINADQALDMIGETKRGWDKAAGQIQKKVPQLKVNADQALDMIGEVTRGLQKIKDKTVTVTVKQSGSGIRTAQHGMHEMLTMDTVIQAHKGERVDIGHGSVSGSSSGSSGGGGSGGGDLTVNNIIDLGDSRILRSFKRKLGGDRYTFGG